MNVMTLNPGMIFGQEYLIERAIGRGGFASAYRAQRLRDGRHFAIKVPSVTLQDADRRGLFLADRDDWARIEQVLEESRQWACCPRHPRLAAFECFRQHGPSIGLVAEWVEGSCLADLLSGDGYSRLRSRIGRARSRRADWMRPCVLGLQMLEGLEALHAAGVLHLDLTPRNVMVSADLKRVKLIDFGLSQPARRGRGTPRLVRGWTPAFAAPEVFGTGRISDKADMYSWGLVMAAMACPGVEQACDLIECTRSEGGESERHLEELRTRARRRRAEFESGDPSPAMKARWPNEAIREVILACLSPTPSRRPSASEAIGELRKHMRSEGHEPGAATAAKPCDSGRVRLFGRLIEANRGVREAAAGLLCDPSSPHDLTWVKAKLEIHAELGNIEGCRNLMPLLDQALIRSRAANLKAVGEIVEVVLHRLVDFAGRDRESGEAIRRVLDNAEAELMTLDQAMPLRRRIDRKWPR